MDEPMMTQSDEPGYESIDSSLYGDEHVRLYKETNGARGYLWNGRKIMLLTTTGRISGEKRTIPILFIQAGTNFVLIASYAGAPDHPAWYKNLLAEPRAQVQVKGKIYDVVARTAQSPERETLWEQAARNWPNYNVYTTRTTRIIPVVVLEPVGDPKPAT